ncbi:MAG: shikimate kinase [Candidatus Omnitrophica bacterium]|nr:shikimate kinase [Candidatus Omnitrophota bacterium]
MNIVLLGFMGTGKTEVSKKIAEKTGLRYVSLDKMIEEKEKMSINDIFTQKGERYFRALESKIVKEASKMDGVVIDAGGGVVLSDKNIDILKKSGFIVCLKARPEVILKRMSGKKDRPLLNVPDRLAKIKELLLGRNKYYEKISESIDTSELIIDEVAEQVINMFKFLPD